MGSQKSRQTGDPQPVAIELLESREMLSTAAPAAPQALTPGTSASPGPVLATLAPKFTWTEVTGVSGYQVHIFDKTDGAYLSDNISGAATTAFTPPAGTLRAGDQFVWNVRDVVATTTSTTTGTVSNYLNFQTPALPAPTVIGPGISASPGPLLTTLTPTFSWKPVTSISGFTGYQINLFDLTSKRLLSIVVPPSSTSYTLPAGDLTAGHSYVWNLRLRDGTQSGAESLPYLYFRAPAPVSLPAPSIVSPGSTRSPGPQLTSLTPTLQWRDISTNVADLAGYQVNLFDLTTGKGVSYHTGASASSYTLATGTLTAGDDYVWNVRAVATDGQTGPPSAYLYFIA